MYIYIYIHIHTNIHSSRCYLYHSRLYLRQGEGLDGHQVPDHGHGGVQAAPQDVPNHLASEHRKLWGKTVGNKGKLWENYGKTMGKLWDDRN